MKKIICLLMLLSSLVVTGCVNDAEFVRYPHEYTGIVETRIRNSSIRMSQYYHHQLIDVIYQADCTPEENTSIFNRIIFDEFDGDNNFKSFLRQNVGKKVRIKVDVIVREGRDHEASYGTFEITDYEVIE